MKPFAPRLEILPPAQRKLWNELSETPREFVLYRGTALALHLGHRHSVDFDFFGNRALDISKIEQEVPFLKGANIIQREKNTLSAIVDRGGPVKVSFFGLPNLPRLPRRPWQRTTGWPLPPCWISPAPRRPLFRCELRPRITSISMP